MTTERLTAADGPQGDDWATEPAEPKAPALSAEERRRRQVIAQDRLGRSTQLIALALDSYDKALAGATEAFTDDLDYGALAETVAWIQAVKGRLGQSEAFVAREMGRLDGCPEIVELPDGRVATVMKGRERKEWRHDDWKRDVRAAVIKSAGLALDAEIVDAENGTFVDLPDLLAKVQAVHGSAAPKSTALKPLGLSADDYCTSGPGPYSVRISTPTDTTTTPKG
jgi:hypothetical protein